MTLPARANPRTRSPKRALLLAALPLVLLAAFAVPAGASINTNTTAQQIQNPGDGCNGTTTLAQANQQPQQILKLLGGADAPATTAEQQQLQQTQSLSQANGDPSATTAPCSTDAAAAQAQQQQRLSTGRKINNAQDDPAGYFLKPLAQCSYKDDGGVFRTVFGYSAKLPRDVHIKVGPKNLLVPKGIDQNQVTDFSSGDHDNAFVVSSQEKVSWLLAGQTVTGPVDTECKDHPVPVSGAVVPAVVLTLVAIPLAGWFFMSRRGKKQVSA